MSRSSSQRARAQTDVGSRSRRDLGQTSAEYLGLLAVLVVLIGALTTTALGRTTADGILTSICQIAGGECTAAGGGPGEGQGTGEPQHVDGRPVRPEAPVPSLADLPDDATPAQVAAFFAEVDEAHRASLLDEDPTRLGALDGAPLDLRFEANTRLIEQAEQDARARAAQLRQAIDAEWNPFARRALQAELERVESRADRFAEWADSDRQFLLFDPRGDGRVAEVLGDIHDARNVAYLVPGVGSTIDNFDSATRADAQRLLDEIGQNHPGDTTAVIAWLGYDPPERVASVATTRADRAQGAVRDLPGFVDGVRAQTGDTNVTVIGHSYGSVATSLAAQDGLEVDTIVLIGSPGARSSSAEHLGGAQVYAAVTPDDPIRHVPNVLLGGAGHGTDPTSTGFGALVFDTGTAAGHSGYLDRGTLSAANVAAIVTGQHDQVVLRP